MFAYCLPVQGYPWTGGVLARRYPSISLAQAKNRRRINPHLKQSIDLFSISSECNHEPLKLFSARMQSRIIGTILCLRIIEAITDHERYSSPKAITNHWIYSPSEANVTHLSDLVTQQKKQLGDAAIETCKTANVQLQNPSPFSIEFP